MAKEVPSSLDSVGQVDPMFHPRVIETLRRAKDPPSMPAVALKVLQVSQDEEANADDLASVVSLDPVLAARVLTASNSVLFCGTGEIASLQRACSRLGFQTVKVLALSFALVGAFNRSTSSKFDRDLFWKRSIIRAVSAKLLAEAGARELRDEAFLIGLLSHIGKLLMASCLPEEYDPVLARAENGWPSSDLEKRGLGFTSVDLGAALLHSWNLPSMIHGAMLQAQNLAQEAENSSEPPDQPACLLYLASICDEFVCAPDKSKTLSELHEAAQKLLGIDSEQVTDILSKLENQASEVAEVLNVTIEGGLQMTKILRQAQEEVLQETLSLLHSAVATEQRATQLEREKSQLLVKAQTDALTGLANRRTFEEFLHSWCKEGGDRLPVGLLMIDVDHFKQINDDHGHPAGDEVLRTVAGIIQQVTRNSDMVARYGGEEFAIIMPRTPLQALEKVAERVRVEIDAHLFETAKGQVSVTVSVGGAHSDNLPPLELQSLVKVADQQLYRAKRAGRNQCMFAQAGLDTKNVTA